MLTPERSYLINGISLVKPHTWEHYLIKNLFLGTRAQKTSEIACAVQLLSTRHSSQRFPEPRFNFMANYAIVPIANGVKRSIPETESDLTKPKKGTKSFLAMI
jgi:hypothetical protein